MQPKLPNWKFEPASSVVWTRQRAPTGQVSRGPTSPAALAKTA